MPAGGGGRWRQGGKGGGWISESVEELVKVG
jgi:hypothetical protein